MKITIDTDDIKGFISTLDSGYDEWYAPVDYMTLSCITDLLEFLGKKKALADLVEYKNTLHD
jgi:hypothetical protein